MHVGRLVGRLAGLPRHPRAPAANPGRGESVEALWDDLRGLACQLQLAALEARNAGEGLVPVVLCSAVVGALMIIAWPGVAVATALWLIES